MVSAASAAGTPEASQIDIAPLLRLMIEKRASDLYFTSNAPVKLRIEGKVVSVGKDILTADIVRKAAYSIMSEAHIERLHEDKEADFAIVREGGRFRATVFFQRGEVALCLRYIPAETPPLDELGLPDILKDLIMLKRGLLLMVGATGSGKSTTLAAMLNYRNQRVSGHILTIEDPIEFVHTNHHAIVNQREIGQDTLNYQRALRSALRAAPDVIQIGEIRDRETMETAIELAGTGHLALSTLHSNNAHQTLDRIVNMFPDQLHNRLLLDLALNLRAVISQRLVMSKNGRRVPAVEVMLNTPHIADLILKGRIDEIREAMEDNAGDGMQSFDMALHQLYRDGVIDLEEALVNADSRTNLEAKINFS
jgi:twitching motility protein PilU